MQMKKNNRPGPRTEFYNELVDKQCLTLFNERQYSFLDNLSRETGKSKSYLIRKAVDTLYFPNLTKPNDES